MTQTKRIFIGIVPCLRCETPAEVRQGGAGFLYTHCQMCGDNFSRSAGFQQKIWSLTEFTVEDKSINFSNKPDGLTIKKNIPEKTTPKADTKTAEQEPQQNTEQQNNPPEQKAESVERIKKGDDLKLSAIIPNNVLLYKEGNKEGTDAKEDDEEEAKTSASRLLLGLGGVLCSGFFLLKWLV